MVVESLVSGHAVRLGHRKARKEALAPKRKQEGLWQS